MGQTWPEYFEGRTWLLGAGHWAFMGQTWSGAFEGRPGHFEGRTCYFGGRAYV